MDVSIVIVSWRVRDLLRRCLQSLTNQTPRASTEIFVVDNDSGDGSAEMVSIEFPHVKLIRNNRNLGFAAGCNQAIRRSTGRYILLLNPDTQVGERTIPDTISFAETRSDAGIIGCSIVQPDGTPQHSIRHFPSFRSQLLILLKLHNIFPNARSLKQYYWPDLNYAQTQAVDQVMGAFFLIRREVLSTIGLLDEHFFVWFEEVDFCKRAAMKNWKTYYFPGAVATHVKSASFSQLKPVERQLFFSRSMLYYFYKHRPRWEYCGLLVVFPFSLVIAFVVQLVGMTKRRTDL
ncbi:MAG: glycosyltransferase family 2 protein [Patescibacteria group bacterium]